MTTADRAARESELVILTGMSGAGRTTAANALEDLGWFVVDNLPPAMLAQLAELGNGSPPSVARIAAVVDVRSRDFFTDLRAALASLVRDGAEPRMVYLEASDDALVRRFESVRRPHPLQAEGRVLDGIERERRMLTDLRGDADLIIDTSNLNVHQLSAKIADAFGAPSDPEVRVTVMSFGFKYGLPVDADMVADCRFLPNPHWVPALRPHTGRDAEVRDYVLRQDGASEFLDSYSDTLEQVIMGYQREGKRFATLAVGCTGGKHRSVAMAEEIARRLEKRGTETVVVHRDLGRE